MGIIWVEFCLKSAHGLQHSTSLWKRQWYAVGWINHNSKYCTKVVDSGNANPVWKTNFAVPVDDSIPNIQDLALNVEVYCIDPIFKEKLHGSATIGLKRFLFKQAKNNEASMPKQEGVRSYQLRKKKSNKPRGYIDILIHISVGKKELNSHPGSKERAVLLDYGNNAQWTAEEGLRQAYLQKQPRDSIHQPENYERTNVPDSYSVPFATTNYSEQCEGEPSYHRAAGPSYHTAAAGPSYQPHRTRTPPPSPPYNVGYIPTYLSRNDGLHPSFTDIPQSMEEPGQTVPPGVVLEISAEALAAGAAIFGDDFLSGFDVMQS
ncbi:uncharacterized protein LOC131626334 [Vicia villosa]|uniref:uncharacterized protein LOC131626334 n=1 Tax=Vicia villosa TaxID=3911 RepID=UPI00273C3AB8|nr:uncharacterized protein LOC131626334 [Vicia villosa]